MRDVWPPWDEVVLLAASARSGDPKCLCLSIIDAAPAPLDTVVTPEGQVGGTWEPVPGHAAGSPLEQTLARLARIGLPKRMEDEVCGCRS